MSPDEVFAAQMWPWPDPIIKRDAMGRVLFVNAAFIQLYGGSVEDWRGNVITGWHAPQAPGVPYRFEIRVPYAEGESVFDWIEYSLADGSALAVARDVTALLPVAAPVVPIAPVEAAVEAPVAEIVEPAPEPVVEEPVHQTPIEEAPVVQAPVEETTVAETPEPVVEEPIAAQAPSEEIKPIVVVEADDESAPLETILEKDDTHFTAPEAEAAPEPVAEAPAPVEPAPAPVAEASPQTEERDFERRALPIENGDAVLGNNWRDAVIAKAVGAAAPATEEAAGKDAAASTAQAEVAPAPEVPSSDGPLRILLAEDNAINALLTRTLLEADGCTVDTVEDGAKAVDAAKAQHYDLIFMDMRMPNMDGLEATRKIRALDNRSKSLPIIALTANAFDDDRNACFDSGMNDFMTKPVSAEELSEMVKTWTKNREQRMAS